MARSHAVYVVLAPNATAVDDECTLLATFTVKHELVTWLGRRSDGAQLVEAGRVWRRPVAARAACDDGCGVSVMWTRREHEWLPRFPDGCRVFYAEDSSMIVMDHRNRDVTKWAQRPVFTPVSECPWCDTTALHHMLDPSGEEDPAQPVVTRECAQCERQWMERL